MKRGPGVLPLTSGDEHDILTRWRKIIKTRAGEASEVKRRYNRRVRRALRPDAAEYAEAVADVLVSQACACDGECPGHDDPAVLIAAWKP